MTAPDLLIDHFLPHPHFELARTEIVDAPVKDTYAAARELDFTAVGGVVSAAARLLPGRRTPDDLDAGSGWTLLGDRPGSEFALGVAAEVRLPVLTWHRVAAEDFAAFGEPGYGKLVLAVAAFPYGPHRTVLTVHTRIRLSDPESWVRFRRYWRLSRPVIGRVHTALIRAIAANARTRALAAYRHTDQS